MAGGLGGEGRKGGKEWEPRGNKPERKERKEGGKEKDGGVGRDAGFGEPPKSQGQGFHGGGGLWKTLSGGFTGGLGSAGGVPIHRCAFAQHMYFNGIHTWAPACLILGGLYGGLRGGCTPEEWMQPLGFEDGGGDGL